MEVDGEESVSSGKSVEDSERRRRDFRNSCEEGKGRIGEGVVRLEREVD